MYLLRRASRGFAWPFFFLSSFVSHVAVGAPAGQIPGVWTSLGPAPAHGSGGHIPPDNAACGAIQTVAAHPTNPDILYIGAANGGIWRTFNATAVTPTWTPLTDELPSLSIGALEFDPTDVTHQTLIAGLGHTSSFYGIGGALLGVLRSTDGGNTWAILGASQLAGYNLTSVAARGNILMAAGDSTWGGGVDGLVRSTNGGVSFQVISGGAGTGLPTGPVSDLVGDPGNLSRFYAAVVREGVFRSDNGGATWNNVTPGITGIGSSTVKIEMAVHNSGTTNAVYAAIINNVQLAGVFRSANQGASWSAMDVPFTGEFGNLVFSIAADPTSPTMVYVCGQFNHFRGDAALPLGSQFVFTSTGDDSYPHADSREMVFDANGSIIETDDGGINRLTTPRDLSTAVWRSVVGNLSVIEAHDVAYDSVANVAMLGAQDNDVLVQSAPGSSVWNWFVLGDGGDVAIDDTSTPGYSIRYGSRQALADFTRGTYDAANNLLSTVHPSLTVLGGGPAIVGQHVTPVVLNKNNPVRLVIGGANGVYESLDRGETVTALAPGFGVNGVSYAAPAYGALAYGGWLGGVANPDVLYYGSGSSVRVRTTTNSPVSATTSPFPGGYVSSIVLDTSDWRRAFVADSSRIYLTPDAGTNWTDVTGNLTGVGSLGPLEFVRAGNACVAVGTDAGVYCSFTNDLGNWLKLGAGLPNAPVLDLAFSATDNLLVAGTLGRGAWAMPDVSGSLTPLLLQARRSGSSLIISWPSHSSGFGLQQNTNLATTNWNGVAQTPTDDGTNKSVTVPISAGNEFFRLLKRN
jgi:hypothetical protein